MRSVLAIVGAAVAAFAVASAHRAQQLQAGAVPTTFRHATDPNLRLVPNGDAADYPPIVGLSFVGRGFDVTGANFTRVVGHGFSHPLGQVVDITYGTYGYTMTWTNPQNQVTYKVPDAMLAMTLDVSDRTNATTTFTGFMDVQIWAEHTVSWTSGFLGMDSHSRTTYDFVGRFFSQDESLSRSEFQIRFLKLAAPPPAPLSAGFKLSVMGLPETCCDDPAGLTIFQDFFDSFGQAYTQEADLGGVLRGETWFAKCLITEKSVHWVTEQSSWSFLGIIGGGHGSSSSNAHISPAFNACYTATQEYAGGDPTGLRPNQYDAWVPTTYSDPWPVKATVAPLWQLVEQAMGKGARSEALKNATNYVLLQSQLGLNKTAAAAAAHDPHHEQQCCRIARQEQAAVP